MAFPTNAVMRPDVDLVVVTTLDAKYANLKLGLYLRLYHQAVPLFSPLVFMTLQGVFRLKDVAIIQAAENAAAMKRDVEDVVVMVLDADHVQKPIPS